MSVKPIPEGFHTVTPVLAVDGGTEALSFYERAFGAEVRLKLVMGGKLMHSELQIGSSIVCVSDSFPEFGSVAPSGDEPVPVAMMLYTEDCDAMYARAMEAGAESLREPADQPYGIRMSGVCDPFGYKWWIGTQIEAMTVSEMKEAAMATHGTV